MFPSSWLNNAPSSSTSCKSVRGPDERCVATDPLQLTAKKATTITKTAANVLLLSILDFIPIPYPMLLAHLRCYGRLPEPVRRGSDQGKLPNLAGSLTDSYQLDDPTPGRSPNRSWPSIRLVCGKWSMEYGARPATRCLRSRKW